MLAAKQAGSSPSRQLKAPSVGFALDGSGAAAVRERGRGVPVQSTPPSPTFAQHLRAQAVAAADTEVNAELTRILEALERSFREISLLLRYGLRTAGSDMEAEALHARSENDVWQRQVLRQDQRVADILLESLRGTRTSAVALETHEGVVDFELEEEEDEPSADETGSAPPAAPPAPVSTDPMDFYTAATPQTSYTSSRTVRPPSKRPRFVVVLDPLGHALNVDAGVSVGTIFGIYKSTEDSKCAEPTSRVLKRGTELIAAGYALYGASTQLVISRGHGVDGFTLHPVLEEFMLTRPRLQMPPTGKVYSVNLGHRHEWSSAVVMHVEGLARTKSLRYIGTFVADVHRTLLYGGVFFYPPSRKRPVGKLRLVYEITPVAFLMEQAGGACTTGDARVLDMQATSINQCVPVAFGSLHDVEAYVRDYAVASPVIDRPPTRGLMRLASIS